MTDIKAALEELIALSEKATPGPWEVDTIRNEGDYGDGGPDSRTGFDSCCIFGADGKSLLDTLNSDAAMVHEEHDEDYFRAWDDVGERNANLAAACVNFLRSHGARLKQALDSAEKLEDSRISDLTIDEQRPLQNDVHRVYFRAGLLACREHMARLVEPQSPEIAASIRANWWSALSADPGAPRRLNWDEVADGGEEGPWTSKTLDVSTEALPVAELFLIAAEKESNEITARASEQNP